MSTIPITVAELLAYEANPPGTDAPPAGDTYVVQDTAANIESLTPDQVTAAAAPFGIGVSAIQSTDTTIILNEAQAQAINNASLSISAPAGKQVIVDYTVAEAVPLEGPPPVSLPAIANAAVDDAAANVSTLTPDQISALPSIGVSEIVAKGASLVLSTAQVDALANINVPFNVAVPTGDYVVIADSVANLAALSSSDISALETESAEARIGLTVAETLSLEGPPAAAAPAAAPPIVWDTAANIEGLSADQISALSSIGITAIGASDGSLVLNVAQVEAIDNASLPILGGNVTIADTAANISSLPSADVTELKELSGENNIGITVEYTLAQALALAASPHGALPSGETAIVLDTAANLETLTANQITALASIGVTSIAATDTPAVLSADIMNDLGSASIDVLAPPTDPGQNDGTTVISGPPGDGMTFDITWDPSVASAPAGFKTDVEEVFQFYADTFVDPTTLYYHVGWGEVNNTLLNSGLGASFQSGVYPISYKSLLAAMTADATSAAQEQAVATLPATGPDGLNLEISAAEATALGIPTISTDPGGYVGWNDTADFNFSPDPNQVPVQATGPNANGEYDFLGAAEHEISEDMGRASGLGNDGVPVATGDYAPIDLFRYSGTDDRALSPFANPSYFSIDNGVTNLDPDVPGQPPVSWNNWTISNGNLSDLADWGQVDLPNAAYTPNSYNDNSNPDIDNPVNSSDVTLMNVLGYDLATPTASPIFGPLANLLFFDGVDGNGQNALWVSQGTAASTHELIGVNGIAGDIVTAYDITDYGSTILFAGVDLNGNDGLWLSNGTAAGTHEITGIANASQGILYPTDMTVVGNEVWFDGTDGNGTTGIWETDGTAAGTHELLPGVSATDMTAYNGEVVFIGRDGDLWATNGTAAGTYEIGGAPGSSLGEFGGESLTAPAGGLDPYGLVYIDGQVLFGGSAQFTYSSEGESYTVDTNFLFSLDGSTIQAISGLAPADTTHTASNDLDGEEPADTPGPILVAPVTVQGDTVLEALFQGDDFYPNYSGGGLDAYDPSTATVSLVDGFTPSLNNDVGSPDPIDMTSVDGFFVFNGQGVGDNNDLYLSDGVSSTLDLNDAAYDNGAGQTVVDDVFTGAQTSGLGLNPSGMTVYNGNVYFNGFGADGQGLWELETNGFFTGGGDIAGPNFEGERVVLAASGFELTGISGANPGGIDPTDITALYDPGPTTIQITVGQLLTDLSLDQINPGTNNAPPGEAYAVVDTAFDIESLTADEMAAGIAIGVEGFFATDTSVVLDVAQAEAIEDPNDPYTMVTVPSGDTVSIADTAADIQGMSLTQLSELIAVGVSTITAVDTSVTLTVAQAIALEDPILVTVPLGDTVTIADSAADIEGLTPAEITALPSIGVTAITSLDASVTLLPLQAEALAAASIEITVPPGDSVTTSYAYDLTAAEIEALTPAEITAIGANGYTSIVSTDASVVLQPLQAQALTNTSLQLTVPVGDTVTTDYTYDLAAAEIETLTPAAITAIAANGYTSIASTDGSVVLTIAQAVALYSGSLNISVPQNDTLSFGDTAADIEALTGPTIAALSNLALADGVAVLAATDTSVVFTVAVAQALEGAPFHVTAPPNDTVTIADTLTAIEPLLNLAQLDALAAVGVSAFTTSGRLALTIAQAVALEGAGIQLFPPPYPATLSVSVIDTAAHIEQLTAAQIAGFGPDYFWGNGLNGITSTDGSVTLTIAQAAALVNSTYILVPSGDTVTTADTAADIETATTAQIAALHDAFMPSITATTGPVELNVAQAEALEAPNVYGGYGIEIIPPAGGPVSVVDTAANIESMSATQLGALQSIGVTAITATSGSVALTVAQAEEIASDEIGVTVPQGGTVTVSDTAANIDAFLASSTYWIGAVAQFDGVSGIVSTDGSVAVTAAAAAALEYTSIATTITVSAPTSDTVTLVDTAADIGSMASSRIAALPSIGVTAITVTDQSLSVSDTEALENTYISYVDSVAPGSPLPISGPDGGGLTLSDTAADIEGMSPTQLSELTSIGVTTVDVTNQSLTLTVAQALALYDPVPIYVPPGDTVIVADTEAEIESLTPTEISQLAAIGVQTVEVTGPLNGEGLTINGGITLSLSAVPTDETITFTGTGGTLALSDDVNGTDVAGTIYGFSPPDTIDLTDVPYDTSGNGGASLGADPNDNQQAIVVTENGNTYYLDIDPSQVFLTGATFFLNPNSGNGTDLTVSELPVTSFLQIFSGTADGLVIDSFVQMFGGTVNRAIIQNGGELLSYGGTINDTVINSGSRLDLPSAYLATGTIDFGPASGGIGGILEIDDGDPSDLAATITGLSVGDTIDLTNVPYDSGGSIGLGNDPDDNDVPAIQINEDGTAYYLDVEPAQDFLNQTFVLGPDFDDEPESGHAYHSGSNADQHRGRHCIRPDG